MQKWLNAVELSELAAENDKTCSCGIAVDWVVCVQWFATVTYVSGLGLKLELRFVKSLHLGSDFIESILEPKSEGFDPVWSGKMFA